MMVLEPSTVNASRLGILLYEREEIPLYGCVIKDLFMKPVHKVETCVTVKFNSGIL